MKKILFFLLPLLSFGQTTYLFDNFSGADNAAKWVTMRTTLISNGSVVDIVEFTSGATYEWATRNHLDGVDGVVFQSTGSAKAILRVTGDVNLISHTNGTAHSIDNATFQNLRFESTHTTASQDNDGGIINFSYGSGDNINFIDLEFTGASAGANAIKSFAGASSSYTNITMDNLDINNMGRMGVEFVNHLTPVTTARYNNIILRNSTIQNTGLIEFGMGCSFSGYITNVTVEDNVFVNNPNCGVELIGVDGGTVSSNNYSGTGDAQHTVRNSAPELIPNTVPNRNINITDDVSTSVGTFSIIGAENITFTNCTWTGQRRGYAQNFANIQFVRCTFETVGQNNSLVSTPLIQALTAVTTLTGDISPNTNIDFDNSIIRAVTNDVNFIELQQGTSAVECSEAYFLSASRMNATTTTDVDYYINDVFDQELGNTGQNCGVIGYVAPTSQIDRYASVAGGGDGTSIGSPWTLSQAISNATAGMTVHVAPGTYTGNFVQSNDGTSESPIIFKGYDVTINDVTVTTASSYTTSSTPDNTFLPDLNASNTNGWMVQINGDFVVFENFQFDNGNFGVIVNGANSVVKNWLVRDVGDLSGSAYSGFGIRLSGANSEALNNMVINCGAENIHVRDNAANAVVRYNYSYSNQTINPTDYYIISSGVDGGLYENNTVERVSGIPHQGHGIHQKFNSDNNIIRNNTLIGTFLETSFGSTGNLYVDNTVDLHFIDFGNTLDDNFGIRIGKNANNNTYRNIYIKDAWVAVAFSSFDEGTADADNAGIDNRFDNLIIETCRHAVGGDEFQNNGHPAERNVFYNMTVYGLTGDLFRARRPLNDFEFYNCVFDSSGGFISEANGYVMSTSTIFSNCNITNSGATASSFTPYNETSITTISPPFADAPNGDFTLTNSNLDIGLTVINDADFNGNTRTAPFSLGAYEFGASTPAPTCSDGIQNGDETGIDCGGSCAPCGDADPITNLTRQFFKFFISN